MPVAAHTPRNIYGRVPPGGWAKRMRSHRHLKHELGPGKALSFLEPLGHFKRKSNRSETRYNVDESSARNENIIFMLDQSMEKTMVKRAVVIL